jgi:KDO2-lipid IV(A) lauroyltransferase
LLLGVQTVGLARLFRGKRIEQHFELEVSDAARAALASGAGCILITAHVGNWEAAGAPLQALGLQPLYAVFKAPKNDPLSRWMQRTREAQGARMLPRAGAMKGLPAVLRAGGSVMMLLDQRARKKPVIAPFFGRPAACDRSAGVLLRRLAAPLVFFGCYTTSDPRRFRLALGTVLGPDDLAGLDAEGVAARLNRELESLILERPDQYFWLHDRYKGAPAARAPVTT